MMRKLDLSSRAALKRHGRNRMIGAKQLATAPVQSSAADLEQSRLMAS